MTTLARRLPTIRRAVARTVASGHTALSHPTRTFQSATTPQLSTPDVPLPSLTTADNSLHLQWPDHTTSAHHLLWLRDNCLCPACIHPTTRQKLHSSADIDPAVRPLHPPSLTAEGLKIVWDRPFLYSVAASSTSASQLHHTSVYPLSFLRTHALPARRVTARYDDLSPTTWTGETMRRDVFWIDHDEFMDPRDSSGLYRTCRVLFHHGLVFLRGVPVVEDGSATTAVAERIGPIRNTFYGRSWDVKSVPKAKNIAYTSLFLGFHMDLLYTDYPPGLQFLHCLHNTVTGGASIFTDSFQAAELLRERYPDDYATLSRVPVTFHYNNDGHHMHQRHLTFAEDSRAEGSAWRTTVNYAPPFQGPLELDDPKEIEVFYRAFRKFTEIVEDEGLRYQLTLKEGECAIFANRRVLHGRTEFDPSSGHRHLKGTYVDLDAFKDRLRVLSAEHAPKG
ncbi:hypothetical protein BC938DRAFT_474831 [Jimgerdemannia flammicorona]|uniref:Gamma-butyrobetaine dioxygenase n=1 Tax=Jimgerdemannia flammicorona TaxID=994334 RepID=A0A433Q1K1_9FUNG|nr:hypothetical protein BC938DRAFT_474831 [Jimgerdemannia flammicorona]